MAETVSPHRRWLGLVQPQPDYYHLLGVDRTEQQSEVLRSAAEARLGLLKSFRDPEGLGERKALAEEIKLAFATLANPAKRAEYDRRTNDAASRGKPSAPPPLAIPVAVPIAQPLAHAPPQAVPPPLAAAMPIPLAQPVAAPQDSLASVAALDAKQRRRKENKSRKWTLTLLGLLLFLGGPMLIISLIWLNSKPTAVAEKRADAPRPAATSPTKKPALEGPFSGLTPPPSEQSEMLSPGTAEDSEPSPSPDPSAEAIGEEKQAGTEPAQPDSSRPPGESEEVAFASPSIRELDRVIWNDLRYRDAATARKRLLLAKGALSSPQEQQQLAAIEELVGHLEKYWKQLVQSAAKLKTGEIKWGEDTAGFVESTDQYVLVKLKGIGLKVSWENLRPDLAAQLVEQAPIADIPTWRLAKASALMLDIQTAREQEPLIRQWLEESAADGYEIGNLEWVLAQRIARRPTGRRLPPPQGQALEQAKRTLREALPEKNFAANNVAGRRTAIEQLLAEATRQPDPSVKYVALERARDHAIRLIDIPLCRELLESLATAFELDVEAKMLESVNEMTSYVQTGAQAERVCEAILVSSGISLTELTKGSAEPKKLRLAEELAQKQGLKQMLDRIQYLTGRN
ncbi:MAG: hypothetical protein ACK6DU_10435 [Planctomycetota bacterium]